MKYNSTCFLLFIALIATEILPGQYCTPTANCMVGDGVTYMAIGPFSNSSGCEADMDVAGYADFTGIPGLSLGQGVTYQGQFQSNFADQQFSIWIDSDLSESFEADELILTDLAVGEDLTTADVTIPADLPLGLFRLRIKANYAAPSSTDPCESTTFGETEDYIVMITEPPTCINVSSVEASDVSATSATINWVDPGTGAVWDIEWGPTGFTPLGEPSAGYDDITNPASLMGLSPVTMYDVYIRADCGMDNVTDVSVWTSAYTFITACGAVQPTYIEDFNAGLGACWEVFSSGDLISGPIDGGYPNWFDDGFANTPGIFTGSQGITVFDNSQNWLVSPDIDLSVDGTFQLEFDLSLTEGFSPNEAVLNETDEVHLVLSTDFGGSWTTIDQWNMDAIVIPSGEHLVYDLTAYDGEIARFAFWVNSGSGSDYAFFDVFVDNFIVQPIGSPLLVEIDQLIEPDCFQFGGNPLADVLINISGGTPPYVFDWSNETSNEDLIDAEAGIYTLTVTDADGTVYTSDPIDVPGTPVFTVTAIVTDESFDGYNDGSIEITSVEGGDGNYNFFWNNGATTQTIDGLINALWCVSITDGANCTTDTCFMVMAGPPVSVSELDKTVGLRLYPNPTADGMAEIQADLSSGDLWSLAIVDPVGRIVVRESISGGGFYTKTIDISGHSQGIYSLRMIRLDDGKEVNRLLIR